MKCRAPYVGMISIFMILLFGSSTSSDRIIPAAQILPETTKTAALQTTASTATTIRTTGTSATASSRSNIEKDKERTSVNSESISDRIVSICKNRHVVGMSLAVFRGETILYTQSYGYSDKENKIKANQDTKYRIASISKAISGMMTMDLVEKGSIDIKKDISEYIGLKIRSPHHPDVPITTWHLLTHTSGITDSSSYFSNATDKEPFITLKTIVDHGGFFHKGKPGAWFVYSNFGAGLLSGVIEGATGKRFYDYAEEALMKPMGIDGGYLRSKIKDTKNLASMYSGGYRSVNLKKWNRIESAYSHFPIGQMYLLAHGDLIISAVDLSRLAMLLCGNGTYGKKIIEKSAIEKINTPQVKDHGNDAGLTLAMSTSLVKGRKLHGHSGQAYGMVAGMYFDPSDKTGVVFITNGCDRTKNSTGNYAISSDILNLVYSKFLK